MLGIWQMLLSNATYSDLYIHIHKLMELADMQRADQHIRSSLGFSILPKDTLTHWPGDWNQ